MSGKILVIDDESTVRNIVVRYLRMNGFDAIAAKDGYEGVKLAGEHVPDLIILDLLMPGIDGYETAKRIKENSSRKVIPIIYLSAIARETENAPVQNRTELYMVKPVGFKKLINAVQTMISLPEPA